MGPISLASHRYCAESGELTAIRRIVVTPIWIPAMFDSAERLDRLHRKPWTRRPISGGAHEAHRGGRPHPAGCEGGQDGRFRRKTVGTLRHSA
jgi:hypothetical protein